MLIRDFKDIFNLSEQYLKIAEDFLYLLSSNFYAVDKTELANKIRRYSKPLSLLYLTREISYNQVS